MAADRFQTTKVNAWRSTNGIYNLSDCVAVEYPTLVDLKQSHGMECCLKIIEESLIQLCRSLNVHRLTEYQIEELRELIYEEAYFLKITELHEFFKRIRKGKYGELYGALDTLKVMTDLALFLKDRDTEITKLTQEKERQRRLKAQAFNPEAVPMPESVKAALEALEDEISKKTEPPKCNSISTALKRQGIL